ncbi:MAG: HAMP domain-containing protein [Rhodospirillales bacterium]
MSDGHPFHKNFPDPGNGVLEEETFLGGVRLSTRISLFVLGGLTALVILAGGLYVTNQEISAAGERLKADRKVAGISAALENRAWRIRNDEKDYLIANDPQYLATHQANVAAFTGMLNDLKAKPDTAFIKEQISSVDEAAAQYTAEFSSLVEADAGQGASGPNNQRNRLENSGKKLEATLASSDIVELKDILASLLKSQADFINYGKESGLARLRGLSGEFLSRVEAAPLADTGKDRLRILIKTYQSHLGAYSKIRLARENRISRLNEIFSYLTTNLDNLSSFAQERHKASARDELKTHRLVQTLLPAGGAALLLAVILFGHVLMRSIAAPVQAMAAATGKLAAGDDEAPIPALGNEDEVGELAFALTGIKARLAQANQLQSNIDAIKAEADNGKAALAETSWLRKDMKAALAEAANLRKELEETKALAEKGETAAIEAALLRIDLEATKAEVEKFEAAARESAAPAEQPDQPSKKQLSSPISTISQQIFQASQNASAAAYDAERTGTLIRGLGDAAEKIAEVESLLAAITEQTDVIVYPADPAEFPHGDAGDNLVVLTSEYRSAVDQASPQGAARTGEANEAFGQRFDSIRATTNKMTWAIREISETLGEVKKLAMEIASASSAEAMKMTSELLEQSEHLRGMLGSLIDNMGDAPSLEQSDDAAPEQKKETPTS